MRTGRTITSVKRPWPAREAGREPRSAPSSVIAGHERLCVRRTTVGAGAGLVIRRGCGGRTGSGVSRRLNALGIRGFMAFQLGASAARAGRGKPRKHGEGLAVGVGDVAEAG